MIEKNSTDGDYFWATLDAHKVVEQRRKALGLSAEFIADKLGINKAWYFDLESESTELSYTLYLWQLEELMHILGLSMTDLFPGHIPSGGGTLSIAEVRDRLCLYLQREGISIAQFEEEAGWSGIEEFLEDPDSAGNWNLEQLADVCERLSIHWGDVKIGSNWAK